MKIIIKICLLILLCSIGFGQTNTIAIHLKDEILKSKKDSPYWDTGSCEYYLTLAEKKCKSDSIYIPLLGTYSYKTDPSPTATEILRREYGFHYVDLGWDTGCILPGGLDCFYEYMTEFSKLKYGSNFMDSITAVSDSLDKINMGYIEPRFLADSMDLKTYLEHNNKDWAKYLDNEKIRLVYFDIETDGRLTNFEFKEGIFHSLYIELVKMPNGAIKKGLLQTMGKLPNWQPAHLKGIPVRERLVLLVDVRKGLDLTIRRSIKFQ